jgi:hypothetical protein
MEKRDGNDLMSVVVSRKNFIKGTVLTAASFLLSCEREDVLDAFSNASGVGVIPEEYGTGADGDITIYYDSGNPSWYPVSIKSLYEDDVVNGVITSRGTNKGLNKKNLDPTDLYDPLNGKYINARNFTVQANASIAGITYDGSTPGNGILEVRCRGKLTIEASAIIDMSAKGFAGGDGVYHNSGGYGPGKNGKGPGSGYGAAMGAGGAGGAQYGDATLTSSDITQLIGSGGGSGSGNSNDGRLQNGFLIRSWRERWGGYSHLCRRH